MFFSINTHKMKKILLIEDDKIMRENISELLDLSGYKTETAQDGKEGIEKAKVFLPDLIVCDIMMPEYDGYSVLHFLRKEKKTASIPFIFLTAKSERADMRKGMNMGADDFLTKPFQDIELLNAVEGRLKKHESLQKELNKKGEKDYEYTDITNKPFSMDYFLEKYGSQEYKAKELLYRIRENAHYLYMVVEGRVKTYKLNEDGKELTSGVFKESEFFGYKPLLEDRIYMEFAETMEQSKICKIPKTAFLSLVYKNKAVANKFIKLISKNLSEKEEEILLMAYSSVRKRIAIKIEEMLKDRDDNYISVSRTDLANMVGTTKETLVRTLTEFKQEGIIKTNGSKINILDRQKLKKLSKVW